MLGQKKSRRNSSNITKIGTWSMYPFKYPSTYLRISILVKLKTFFGDSLRSSIAIQYSNWEIETIVGNRFSSWRYHRLQCVFSPQMTSKFCRNFSGQIRPTLPIFFFPSITIRYSNWRLQKIMRKHSFSLKYHHLQCMHF
jgi:hypothetical protein